METRGTLFREIHKNTWLKRLTVDNRKVTVGSKKSDRSWVVFCVHDDCEAILEGYVEPRQAASHTPEWTVPLQNALHISHALIPSEHEYEFVITLTSDVVRFNAASWEIMHEWVETLRLKLREMKILSPKENLYSKLPEIRAPLLPTRDPTSPLPAPPPVPAALVPGIERITTATNSQTTTSLQTHSRSGSSTQSDSTSDNLNITSAISSTPTNITASTATTSTVPTTAMSNTLTQNLINMLSNPVSAYSHQVSHITSDMSDISLDDFIAEYIDEDDDVHNADEDDDDDDNDENTSCSTTNNAMSGGSDLTNKQARAKKSLFSKHENLSSLAKTFATNVLADPNTCPSTSMARDNNIDGCSLSSINDAETSSIDSLGSSVFQAEPIVIPRPQTSRSSARENHHPKRVPQTVPHTPTSTTTTTAPPKTPTTLSTAENTASGSTNITIIQVSSPIHASTKPSPATTKDIFNFPHASATSTIDMADDNYKSNVQIIPSNFTPITTTSACNTNTHYVAIKSKSNPLGDANKVTTVQVSGATSLSSGYGRIIKQSLNHVSNIDTTTSAIVNNNNNCQTSGAAVTNITNDHSISNALRNFGAVTNIPIGVVTSSATTATVKNTEANTSTVQLHYEQVFVTSSASTSVPSVSSTSERNENSVISSVKPSKQHKSSTSHTELHINRINLQKDLSQRSNENSSSSSGNTHSGTSNASMSAVTAALSVIPSTSSSSTLVNNQTAAVQLRNTNNNISGSKIVATMRENLPSPLPAIRKLLTRGLTEAAITRPNRKEPTAQSSRGRSKNTHHTSNQESHSAAENSPQQEQREHRRRSSSHSDAQGVRSRGLTASNNNSAMNESRRMQPAPQPFRPGTDKSPHSSRLTLREQQVIELRKEMMHPGGVRIQLRRKDCVGSIALADAFGAVWISGWKQKDYPILYTALHIGDQLVSVAGVNISSAAEANKIIRNVGTIYIELIIRRIPFGRVYAIRREMDGQCLGLIRDGNTATIVDVVPKSLSARHGLPPKAQSCDGLSLTFWVLTEINGRPLNLFFKENEVRDRLNAIGRDISILVQPSDLIVKLKKQLKSLRGYKEYIVQ